MNRFSIVKVPKMKIIYALFKSSVLNAIHDYLSESINLKPVYVVGDSNELHHKDFAGVQCHSIKDSRNGIPLEKYSDSYTAVCDDSFHLHMAQHEEMALSMMGRQSESEWDFSYSERKRHFLYLCNYWNMVIEATKADVVLFRCVPHFASEYILFNVCEYYKIKCITVETTGPFGYSFLIENINDKSSEIRCVVESGELSSTTPESIDYVDSFIKKNRMSYDKAIPEYYNNAVNHQLRSQTGRYLLMRAIKDILGSLIHFRLDVSETVKRTKYPVYDKRSHQKYFTIKMHQWNVRKTIANNRKIYKSLCNKTELPDKYVLLAPNYQPERSTMPDAGEYHDVLKLVDVISSVIPDDWSIIYKEHPMIFNYPGNIFYRGHLFRGLDFYRSISRYKNVVFCDYNSDTFSLIDKSKAVFTATGTIAVQSSIRGKAAVVFGDNWFTSCDQIYKFEGRDKLKKYLMELNDDNLVTEDGWRRYLKAICTYGFIMPDLYTMDDDFSVKNEGYLKSLRQLLLKSKAL